MLIYRSGIFKPFLPALVQVSQGIHGGTLHLLAVSFNLVTKVSCWIARGRLEPTFRALHFCTYFFTHEDHRDAKPLTRSCVRHRQLQSWRRAWQRSQTINQVFHRVSGYGAALRVVSLSYSDF